MCFQLVTDKEGIEYLREQSDEDADFDQVGGGKCGG